MIPAIVTADSYSRAFERSRNPDQGYQDEQQTLQDQINAQKTQKQRTMDWLSDNRYSLVFGGWVVSMAGALGIVSRNPYLTVQQKLVHSRMYAQGITIALVILSLALETNESFKGKGRWETVKILDPNDPTHKHIIEKKIHHEAYAGGDRWRDRVEAEEQRLREREEAVKRREHNKNHKNGNGKSKAVKEEDLDKAERGKKPEEAKSDKLNAP